MKNIKNIFKKNQVIIAALAIMIIVAGYLNFTRGKINNNGNNDVETNANISDDQLDIADGDEVDDNGKVVVADENQDAGIEAENAKAEESAKKDDAKKDDAAKKDAAKQEASKDDSKKSAQSSNSDAGEAVLANQGVDSDYFVSNKLKREQTRSKNEETLNAIINNSKATDNQKQDAIDQMISLTDIKEKESVTETLLEAKGFSEALVTINDGKVEVVVNANNLTEQQIAQIEDVVKRKSGIAAKNIVITPVKVNSTASEEITNGSKDESGSKKTTTGSEKDNSAQGSEKSEKSE